MVFLDIEDRVQTGGERGLLGLAFHPEFATNGTFFVNYTARGQLRTRVSRFRVDPNDASVGLADSEEVLLEFSQPFGNHNGGQLTFGPDGYLYIATGDGGAGGDPQNNAQRLTNLLGKILRIDVDTATADRSYGIPADNPFVGQDGGAREEIYAYGLRNPWRIAFDEETGRLWAADVGQGFIEEVDLIVSGGNYGWRRMEGSSCFNPSSGCRQDDLILPVDEYQHSLGRSITGGYVYRGTAVPSLVGDYIFGDYDSGRIWALRYSEQAPSTRTELLDTRYDISSFGVDEAGELYVLDYEGEIYRFAASSSTDSETNPDQPGQARLETIYPNPAVESTTIRYILPETAFVEVEVFDALGRTINRLVTARVPAGQHEVEWFTPGRQASGWYGCRLWVDGVEVDRQAVVVM